MEIAASDDLQAHRGLTQVQRVVDAYVAPTRTFTDILRSTSWWLPYLLIAIVALGTTYAVDRQVGFEHVAENQIHSSPKQSERFDALAPEGRATQLQMMAKGTRYSAYGSFVLVLVFLALFALIYWASFNFGMGARTTYSQMLAVWMYASLPKLIAGILTIITLFAGLNLDAFNLQNPLGTNLAYYLPDSAPWLRAGLSFIDIFGLWQLALLVLGTRIVARVSTAQAATVAVGWWFVGLVLSVALAAAFS